MTLSRSPECPGDETLSALVEHTLPGDRLGTVEAHVDGCAYCREMIGHLSSVEPPSDTHQPVGRYRLDEPLGAGGMGVVWRAWDPLLERPLAIKLLRRGIGSGGAAQLLREARALAKLQHPNIVAVHDVGELDGEIFIATELVEGEPLDRWQAGRSAAAIIAVYAQAAQGLAAAHAIGLVHRDVKPNNIFVGHDGRARVGDFGLATVNRLAPVTGDADDATTAVSEDGVVVGTLAYMAPEQRRGEPVDARADQFSFCTALAEALRPHTAAVRGAVRENVKKAIARGMSQDPAARFESMDGLLRVLAPPPAVRTRYLVAGGAALVIATGLVVPALRTPPAFEPCADGGDALAGVLDGPQLAAIRTAFVAADPATGELAFQRVHAALSDYANDWRALRRESCQATRVRGDKSERLLDLRMMCLDRYKLELSTIMTGLSHADAALTKRSMQTVLGLPPVAQCADDAALTAPMAPLGLPTHVLVDNVRSELVIARAEQLLGKLDDATTAIAQVVARAAKLGYAPLIAEALYTQGDLTDRNGDTPHAITQMEQSIVEADRGNHRFVAAEAWSALAWMLATENREFDRAEWAAKMAQSALDSLGGNTELQIQLFDTEGLILETEGKLVESRAKYLEGVAMREKLAAGDDWRLAIELNDLGGTERRLGNYAAARADHTRALGIRKRVFGDNHMYTLSSTINLGTVAFSERDYAAAERQFRAAGVIGAAIYPKVHPKIALIEQNLGETLVAEGKLADGEDHIRRALAIIEKVRGPDHPDVADALHDLGEALADQHKDADAAAAFERALAILDKKEPSEDPRLSGLLSDYAELLIKRKDAVRAEQLLMRAIAVDDKIEKDGTAVAQPLTVLGDLEVKTGRAAAARPQLERALELRQGPAAAGDERAATEFALAGALWATPADHPRAVALAHAALGRLKLELPADRETADAINAWLAAHH